MAKNLPQRDCSFKYFTDMCNPRRQGDKDRKKTSEARVNFSVRLIHLKMTTIIEKNLFCVPNWEGMKSSTLLYVRLIKF
jgi:hypothetical protein